MQVFIVLFLLRYPLLLSRLYKATPDNHPDKEDIREAREKLEDILSHINAVSSMFLLFLVSFVSGRG